MGFVRQLLMLALRIFFRKIEIEGQENIPMDKAVIFTPNHQNAFLDAILTGVFAIRQPYFLARGDIFRAKWASYLLKGIHIWPIFRARDGLKELDKNQAVFESVGELLKQKASVLIFPEANHQLGYQLLPVRKGFARIALATEEQADFQLDTQVVPVALHYEAHPFADRKVYVKYGKAIATRDFESLYRENPQKGLNAFRIALDERMRSMIVDWDREGERPPFSFLKYLFGQKDPYKKSSPQTIFQQDQQLHSWLATQDPVKLMSQYKGLEGLASKMGLQEREMRTFFQEEKTSPGRLLWSSLPSLYGWINHLIFLWVIKFLLGKFEDKAFHASLMLAAGIIVLPLVYFLQISLVGIVAGWHPWAWLYALSLPLSGILLLRNNNYWQNFWSLRRLRKLQKRHPENWRKWVEEVNKCRS